MLKLKYRPEDFGKIIETNLGSFFVRQKGDSDSIVWIEPGLGSLSTEWWKIQNRLCENATVLCYDRPGYGWSAPTTRSRTPLNVAEEIKSVLDALQISKPVSFIAHSLGGLYIRAFMKRYPSLVQSAIFLDPMSPMDFSFKEKLSIEEYKGSGVDKTNLYRTIRLSAQFRVMHCFKKLILNSPPFIYYKDLTDQSLDMIWRNILRPTFFTTILNEYQEAHLESNVHALMNMQFHFTCPVTVLCHDKKVVVEEIISSGKLTREKAQRVENIWKELIREYCDLSVNSKLVEIKGAGHYVHMSSQEYLSDLVRNLICRPLLTAEIVKPNSSIHFIKDPVLVQI